MNLFLRKPSFSRRRTSRVDNVGGVSVYWRCNGRDDVSSVGDVSFGGLLIKTRTPRPVGAPVELDFLVEEGQIRAEAVVRHLEPSGGLGLKFTAMPERDRPRLGMLITRLRHCSRSAAAIRLRQVVPRTVLDIFKPGDEVRRPGTDQPRPMSSCDP